MRAFLREKKCFFIAFCLFPLPKMHNFVFNPRTLTSHVNMIHLPTSLRHFLFFLGDPIAHWSCTVYWTEKFALDIVANGSFYMQKHSFIQRNANLFTLQSSHYVMSKPKPKAKRNKQNRFQCQLLWNSLCTHRFCIHHTHNRLITVDFFLLYFIATEFMICARVLKRQLSR